MKLRNLIGIVAPSIAMAGLILHSTQRPEADHIGIDDDSLAAEELPAWVREPPPYLPSDLEPNSIDSFSPVIAANAARANTQIMAEIRAAVIEDLANGFSPAVSDEYTRYLSDPDWPRMPAVPGISGFDIQICAGLQECLSDYLAEEPDEPAWSRTMESQLYDAMANRSSLLVSQLHVVCRQSTCGLLLPYSPGSERLNAIMIGGELADELGFVGHAIANRPDFQALYFTRSEEQASATWIQ